MTLTFVSWFSGIGGFDVGLARAGWSCVGACELDPFARRVYGRRLGAPAFFPEDICRVDPDTIPPATLWCAGFPCQDLSNAGKRAGITAGARSGLVWRLLDLWDAVAARDGVEWLLLENVQGLLTGRDDPDDAAAGDPARWDVDEPTEDAAWMGILLGALADRGLRYAWRVLDAQHFGLAQRRKRVFLLASRGAGDGPGPREVLLDPDGVRRGPPTRSAAGAGVAAGVEGGARGGVLARRLRARSNLAHREDADTLIVANALEASDGYHGRSSPRGDGHDNLIVAPPDEGRVAATIVRSMANAKTGHTQDANLVVSPPVTKRILRGETNGEAAGECLVFAQNQRDEVRDLGHLAGAVAAQPGMKQQTFVAYLDARSTRNSQGGTHASTSERNPVQDVPRVRDETRAQAPSERGHGVPDPLPSEEVLQPPLHGEELRRTPSEGGSARLDGEVALTQDGSEETVREVSGSQRDGRTSSRRKSEAQRAGEPRASLSVVSSQGAQDEGNLSPVSSTDEGPRVLRQALPKVQEVRRRDEDQGQPASTRSVVRRLTPREAELLQGFLPGHTCLCGVAPYSTAACRCADGPRYRVLGNAVPPPVVAWIGRRLAHAMAAPPPSSSA